MPRLRIKYMVDDYLDLEEEGWNLPNLKLEYMVPDFQKLKEFNPDQLSFELNQNSTAA